jgi:hypothetical protein
MALRSKLGATAIRGRRYIMKSVLYVLKQFAVTALVTTTFLAGVQSAHAQSAMPYGLWRGQNSGDFMQISFDQSCSASGLINVAGRCEWLPTSTGGVLNMYYPMPLRPGRIGWSVTWLDRNTLLINGVERFVRVG